MEVWASKTVRVVGFIFCMKLPGIKRISIGKIQEEMRFPLSFPVSAITITPGILVFIVTVLNNEQLVYGLKMHG